MRKIIVLSLLSTLTLGSGVGSAIAQEPKLCGSDGNSPINQQDIRCAGRRSLTVIGQGLVTAPADVALLEFRFGKREQPGTGEDAPGLSLQTARQFTETMLQPPINALKKMGIPANQITIQTSSIQNPKLLVKLDKPTQEKIQSAALAVDQSLKSSQQLFLQGIGAGYSVNRCTPLERSARQIALRDAQTELTALAQELAVGLGKLLAVTVLPLAGPTNSIGCGTKIGIPSAPLSFTSDETLPPYPITLRISQKCR
jgi:uncharacterized protein YggE